MNYRWALWIPTLRQLYLRQWWSVAPRAIVCAFVEHPVAVASCVDGAGLPTERPQVPPYPQQGINRRTLDIFCIQTAPFTFRETSVLCLLCVWEPGGVISMWNVKVCLIGVLQEQATSNTVDVSRLIFEVTFPVHSFSRFFLFDKREPCHPLSLDKDEPCHHLSFSCCFYSAWEGL